MVGTVVLHLGPPSGLGDSFFPHQEQGHLGALSSVSGSLDKVMTYEMIKREDSALCLDLGQPEGLQSSPMNLLTSLWQLLLGSTSPSPASFTPSRCCFQDSPGTSCTGNLTPHLFRTVFWKCHWSQGMVSVRDIFCPQGTFGNVWRHFWLPLLVGRSQGCYWTSYNA